MMSAGAHVPSTKDEKSAGSQFSDSSRKPKMNDTALDLEQTGLEVIDLQSNSAFGTRKLHNRDAAMQMEAMQRLAQCFLEQPDTILQELVNAAVDLCGADSAGISIEQENGSDTNFYRWVATAGEYSGFLDATLPRFPSACSICLERGRPQLFRVSQQFFDLMGVQAPTVTDGILLPWQVEETRGTIWIMAHGRQEAFDESDCRMMQALAKFVAMGVRQQRQQKLLLKQTRIAAAASMANDLAHKINNPLQGLTNILYLAAEGQPGGDSKTLAQLATGDLQKLSALVKKLLELPFVEER